MTIWLNSSSLLFSLPINPAFIANSYLEGKEIAQKIGFPLVIRPSFTLGGTGIFGSTYQPRVIWLKINDSNGFQTLAGKINEAILPLGFIPDRQNFVPHLTLGRINFLNDKKYFQDIINKYKTFSSEPQMVSEYHLFESKIKPTGPEYTIIKTNPIGNY